jgi:hypothetical protein
MDDAMLETSKQQSLNALLNAIALALSLPNSFITSLGIDDL